jgi:DNA anti-recombination protein RmuC
MRTLLLGSPPLAKVGAQRGATVDDLAEQLTLLNRSVAGTDESTLASRLQLLRTDTNERLDRLNHSSERYAEKMAEANAKALIEALSVVIKDFNTRLDDQFGQNFQDLNAGVEKLVTWQKQYEQQLNALIEQETATRKSMTEASLRYADLVNKSTVFTTTAESLRDLLIANEARSQQLYSSLWRLGEQAATAADSLSKLEQDERVDPKRSVPS